MGGPTFDQRLKASGIDARKNAEYGVPVGDLWYPSKDDPIYGSLAHPREHDELDQDLIDDMIERFDAGKDPIEYPALVWNVGPGVDNKLRLLVINGCRRDKHGQAAQDLLRAAGKLKKNDVIRINVDQWTPPKNATDAEIFAAVIFERLKQNNDPHKKPDSNRVLADTVRVLRILGKTDREIQTHMPKGVGLREIEALAHYDDLHPEARAKFDAGAPVGLLPAVLEASRENHAEKATEVIATGATSIRGVTRAKNAAAKEAVGKPRMKMNAQRVESVADIFIGFHKGEQEKRKEDKEYDIDYTFLWIGAALLAANGDNESLEEIRKALPDDAARIEFDRKTGKVKGTGRGRGRPRKTGTVAPVVETPPEVIDDADDESEDEEDDEDNQFAGIFDRPDTEDDDETDTPTEDTND
jgi:hypothetical protein